jgi:hypothetical protein
MKKEKKKRRIPRPLGEGDTHYIVDSTYLLMDTISKSDVKSPGNLEEQKNTREEE